MGNTWAWLGIHNGHLFCWILGMGDGFDRYSADGSPDSSHEAGYDAYMTGVIYLGFIYFVKEKEGRECLLFLLLQGTNSFWLLLFYKEENKSTKDDSSISNQSASDSEEDNHSTLTRPKEPIFMGESITPYYNKIFVMRCDTPYIDLQEKETMREIEKNTMGSLYWPFSPW